MKRAESARKRDPDELRPEYDFARMSGGVRGRFAGAYQRGTNLARLEPDVAKAFTTDESVNEALRAVLLAASAIPTSRRARRARTTTSPTAAPR